MTKVKLAQRYVIKDLNVVEERYTKAVGGKPWSTMMRKTVALHIKIECGICYINELVPEQQSRKTSSPFLIVSRCTLHIVTHVRVFELQTC